MVAAPAPAAHLRITLLLTSFWLRPLPVLSCAAVKTMWVFSSPSKPVFRFYSLLDDQRLHLFYSWALPLERQPARSRGSPPWSQAGWRRSPGPPPPPGRCSARRRPAGWHSSHRHAQHHLGRRWEPQGQDGGWGFTSAETRADICCSFMICDLTAEYLSCCKGPSFPTGVIQVSSCLI